MNDEPLDEYGCMDCIHDDEEDHTEGCSRFAAVYFKTEKEAQAFADKLNMENGMPVSKTEFEPEYKEMSLF